jgi:tRNA (guanine37-N1)-methyltransferase
VDGVLNNDESAKYESFAEDKLEYPQYTRPAEFEGRSVPDVLLSGNHKLIEKWRLEKSLERTRVRRPDLYEQYLKNHTI